MKDKLLDTLDVVGVSILILFNVVVCYSLASAVTIEQKPPIVQSTTGNNSPVITNTNGDVVIGSEEIRLVIEGSMLVNKSHTSVSIINEHQTLGTGMVVKSSITIKPGGSVPKSVLIQMLEAK